MYIFCVRYSHTRIFTNIKKYICNFHMIPKRENLRLSDMQGTYFWHRKVTILYKASYFTHYSPALTDTKLNLHVSLRKCHHGSGCFTPNMANTHWIHAEKGKKIYTKSNGNSSKKKHELQTCDQNQQQYRKKGPFYAAVTICHVFFFISRLNINRQFRLCKEQFPISASKM